MSKLKGIHSPGFCRFVLRELADDKKIADVAQDDIPIVVRACDAYLDYHKAYPNVTGDVFLVAARNCINKFLYEQKKLPIISIERNGEELVGLRASSAAKNFGDL